MSSRHSLEQLSRVLSNCEAIATRNVSESDGEGFLSIRQGQRVILLDASQGGLVGVATEDGKLGIIPSDACVKIRDIPNEKVTGAATEKAPSRDSILRMHAAVGSPRRKELTASASARPMLAPSVSFSNRGEKGDRKSPPGSARRKIEKKKVRKEKKEKKRAAAKKKGAKQRATEGGNEGNEGSAKGGSGRSNTLDLTRMIRQVRTTTVRPAPTTVEPSPSEGWESWEEAPANPVAVALPPAVREPNVSTEAQPCAEAVEGSESGSFPRYEKRPPPVRLGLRAISEESGSEASPRGGSPRTPTDIDIQKVLKVMTACVQSTTDLRQKCAAQQKEIEMLKERMQKMDELLECVARLGEVVAEVAPSL